VTKRKFKKDKEEEDCRGMRKKRIEEGPGRTRGSSNKVDDSRDQLR
jgi:hypothetical protein